MQVAYDQFKLNMTYVHELDALHTYLTENLNLLNDLGDLLRAEWVYAVSAMDKFIHEIVRIGMLECFNGTKSKTDKFKNFSIPFSVHSEIHNSLSTGIAIPPPDYWFEAEIIKQHGYLSFQEPNKINEILGYIWPENYKWQKIADAMGYNQKDLVTQLKAIITRRNQIVHEGDLDQASSLRNNIEKSDSKVVVTFIENLSETIFQLVK